MDVRKAAILVVEDEAIIRMMAMDMVESAGFEAIEATDSTMAVRILEHRADIQVVFSDIDMPRGMDGMMLATSVKTRWPSIGIILTSEHFLAGDPRLPDSGRFFSKPYREREIVAAMRAMIN